MGIMGDYEPIKRWFGLLQQYTTLAVQLLEEAYTRNSAIEVSLVLNSIRCGLYSQDVEVCEMAVSLLTVIGDRFYQTSKVV